MKKLIIFALLITYTLAAPYPQDDDDEELSFDDLSDAAGDTVIEEKPVKTEKKPESYIQKIPRRHHIKDGEELKKCLTEDPAKGHPHLIKTDIQDVAEVLITHTKTEPEHIHKFGDIPAELQQEDSPIVRIEVSTSVSVSTTEAVSTTTATPTEIKVEAPKATEVISERKKRESDRPTKVRLPKLKLSDVKKKAAEAKKPEEEKSAEPKPEPIPIKLHEVAGFEAIKPKSKRDTDAVRVRRHGFVRPKPVSEILKHHAIQKVEKKEEDYDDEEEEVVENLPLDARKEPPPKFSKPESPKSRTRPSSS